MLSAVNESTKLVTLQLDGCLQQLDGACRRVDELEARMAETIAQTNDFVAQLQHEANKMMQTASSTNLEIRRKLAQREHEAQALRAQFAEANARNAIVVASTSNANAANMIRCLRHHHQHAKDEVAALTARMQELSLMLLTSRRDHTQHTKQLQLQLDHATAATQRMSQEHESETEKLYADLDASRAENMNLRVELNAAKEDAARVNQDLDGTKAALQLQLATSSKSHLQQDLGLTQRQEDVMCQAWENIIEEIRQPTAST